MSPRKLLPANPITTPGELTMWALQHAPPIPRPNLAATFIPVAGPLWDGAVDVQEEKYLSAGFNNAMAIADIFGVGELGRSVKSVRALNEAKRSWEATKAARGWEKASEAPGGIFQGGKETAKDMSRYLHISGIVKKGEHAHHIFPLREGLPESLKIKRVTPSLRNLPINFKALSKADHRLVHLESTPWLKKVQLATPDWAPPIAAGLLGYVTDSVENVARRQPNTSPQTAPVSNK